MQNNLNKYRTISASRTLSDFQWRFVVSTTKGHQKGECFIQVKFVFKDQTGKIEDLVMDLSMSEFGQFYGQMQKIAGMIEIVG